MKFKDIIGGQVPMPQHIYFVLYQEAQDFPLLWSFGGIWLCWCSLSISNLTYNFFNHQDQGNTQRAF